MSPPIEHEELKDTVTLLVNTLAEEMGINTEVLGQPPSGAQTYSVALSRTDVFTCSR